LVVTAALGALALPASADELLVGALRDQDGSVVAGARVEAVDANGAVVARDRSAADGTFALSAPARPAAVIVRADDADPLRIAVPPAGTPLAGIVRRHRAAGLVPSAADVASLPAASLAEVGSVIPYRVAFPGEISDRWLARGIGVTTVEGMPFYRRGDGSDTTILLPAHAFGAVETRDALQAPWYGDRAGAGIVDARLFDRLDAVRVTGKDASLVLGRNLAAIAATSWDPDGERQLVGARLSGVIGPATGSLLTVFGTAPGARYSGIAGEVRGSTRVLDLNARVDLTRDVGTFAARDVGTVTSVVLDARGRGPDAVAVRARWRDDNGTLGALDQDHHDAALVVGTSRGNVARVTAALALAYGDEHGYEAQERPSFAVLPSLAFDAPLGGGVSAHAGYGVSTLGTPGTSLARATLGEIGFAFTDRRRLRADVVAYAEGDSSPRAVTRGFGASLGWEIVPRVSLRAWSLRDGDVEESAGGPIYAGGPVSTFTVRQNFQRDVVWLTWDAPVRIDLLVRGGALEGNVRLPLGARYALTAGSWRRRDNTRALSVGVVAR
jgi:hypothetical protein